MSDLTKYHGVSNKSYNKYNEKLKTKIDNINDIQ